MMNEKTSAEHQQAWLSLAERADQNGLEDVSVMDIYNVKLPKGMPCLID